MLEAGDVGFDMAHRQAPFPALLEQIGAEAADARHVVGEVNLAVLLQLLLQVDGRDRGHDGVHPFQRRERTVHGDEFAVDAINDRRGDLEMHIRRAAFHRRLQNFIKEFHYSW